MSRIKEAIQLYLETEGYSTGGSFVGVQVVEVETC
jgi:predicted RNase H-like HicB family nuclease